MDDIENLREYIDVVAVYLISQKEQVELIKNAFELTIR